MKFIYALIVVFVLFFNLSAQKTEKKWVEIGSQKNELIFSVPSDYLVDNEEKELQILGFQENCAFRVKIEPTSDAKSRVKSMRKMNWHKELKLSTFVKDEFVGNVYSSEAADKLDYKIYIASEKALYTIYAESAAAKKEILEKFLFSVRLNGKSLFKQNDAAQESFENFIPIAMLKTSKEVVDALNQKDGERTKPEYEKIAEEIKENPEITRPSFILRKPRPSYTDSARQDNISGTVGLKVEFLADGQIGKVKVVRKLYAGLDSEAAAAAKKIKFLPAQINGKNVDSEMFVEYTFTIY